MMGIAWRSNFLDLVFILKEDFPMRNQGDVK